MSHFPADTSTLGWTFGPGPFLLVLPPVSHATENLSALLTARPTVFPYTTLPSQTSMTVLSAGIPRRWLPTTYGNGNLIVKLVEKTDA